MNFFNSSNAIDTAGNEKPDKTVWTIPNTAGNKFNPVTPGRDYLVIDEQPELPMFSVLKFTGTNIHLKAYTVDDVGKVKEFDSYNWR